MINLTIHRQCETKGATPGTVVMDEQPDLKMFSIELPWKNDAPDVSCIPSGIYQCVPHGWGDSGAHMKDVWEVTNVPGRSGVLIHAGNTVRDTEGCIIMGLTTGIIDGLPAVLHSQQAIGELRSIIGQNEFILTVIGHDEISDQTYV